MANLIAFYNEVTGLVDDGRAVDIVYLDISKAFDTHSYKILIDKLLTYTPDEDAVRWTENWINSWAQRVMVSETEPSWSPVTSGEPQASILGSILFT